jgi:hypothetical protein
MKWVLIVLVILATIVVLWIVAGFINSKLRTVGTSNPKPQKPSDGAPSPAAEPMPADAVIDIEPAEGASSSARRNPTTNNPQQPDDGQLIIFCGMLLYLAVLVAGIFVPYGLIALLENGITFILANFGLPGWEFHLVWPFSLVVGVVITTRVLKHTYRWFIVNIPEFMALILVNLFGGGFRKRGTGLTVMWPWEQVRDDMWFILEVITVTFGMKCPTSDGGEVEPEGLLRYQVSMERLETYAGVDEASIGLSFIGGAQRVLTQKLATTETDKIAPALPEIQTDITAVYQNKDHVDELESQTGVDFVSVEIPRFKFGTDTQKTLATNLFEKKNLKGRSEEERNDVLTVHTGGKVEKKINQVHVTGLDGLLVLIAKMFGATPEDLRKRLAGGDEKPGK